MAVTMAAQHSEHSTQMRPWVALACWQPLIAQRPGSRREKFGRKIELVERDEPEQKQPKTIITEIYLDALWMRILGLARAGIEKVQDKPSAAESDVLQTYDYV